MSCLGTCSLSAPGWIVVLYCKDKPLWKSKAKNAKKAISFGSSVFMVVSVLEFESSVVSPVQHCGFSFEILSSFTALEKPCSHSHSHFVTSLLIQQSINCEAKLKLDTISNNDKTVMKYFLVTFFTIIKIVNFISHYNDLNHETCIQVPLKLNTLKIS